MRGFPHLSAILFCIGCSSVGCRLLDSSGMFQHRSEAVVLPTGAGTDTSGSLELLDGLIQALNHDTWNSDPRWSVVAAWDARSGLHLPVHKLRWKLGSGEIHRWLDEQQKLVGVRPVDQSLRKLSRRTDLVGYNAAVIWAQRNPAQAEHVSGVLRRLSGPSPPRYQEPDPDGRSGNVAVRHRREISPPMRAAAAEAWCRVLARGANDPQAGLTPAARVLRNGGLPPLVTAEYFLGLSRWVAPDLIPRLPASLRSGQNASLPSMVPGSSELRSAALQACVLHALWNGDVGQQLPESIDRSLASERHLDQAWPQTIWDCQWDDDGQIKNQFGLWIALVRMPGALETLEDQLLDLRPEVRRMAIVSLGFLGTADAQRVLLQQAESASVPMRAEAVRSLARWGADPLFAFVADDQAEIRAAAVAGLRGDVSPRVLLQVRRALTDPHALVQMAAVDALVDVPDQLALSLLFYGLQESQFRARKACWHAITDRLGRPFAFPINKPLEQRRQAARTAARNLQLQPAVLELVLEEGLEKPPGLGTQQRDDVRRRVDALLAAVGGDANQRQVALQRVRQLTVEDVSLIEEALPWPDPRTEIVFAQVLPHLHPVYATLNNWNNSDHLRERQRAAAELLLHARRQALSPLMLERLHQVMRREQDRQIWKHVYDVLVIQPDRDVSQRIVQLMLNQPSAVVRRMGCEWVSQNAGRFVTRHGQWMHALWLHPLFEDTDESVQLAAVRAAGHTGHPVLLEDIRGTDGIDVHSGLRTLYHQTDGTLRFAVAVSMSRLGDRRGTQELLLLTRDPLASQRIQAVQAIGESSQPAVFVPHLVGLLQSEPQQQVRGVVLQSLLQLVAEHDRPPELQLAMNEKKKCDVWRRWLDERP